ncbi:glutaminase [Flavobacterium sp. '19STA2R22 D10 B1']|uniref:glutaminase n=1 Tax=Flavobacterium aerium TaxID=3037261 RepID=UPI00278BD3CC|nr:glutaminase [Flavobacterium sp. '19STA2R22 D10 B1']
MNYDIILKEIAQETKTFKNEGAVSLSIPELAKIDPSKFGIHIITIQGENYAIGDSNEKFSIQSVSKVLTLSLAFSYLGEKIWERVGVEPSGDPFNSLVQLEYEMGKPRNPFINAGALVIADMLVSIFENPKEEFLNFVKNSTACQDIDYNYNVALSEKNTGYRNAALANLLKSFGNIENDVDKVLDFYYHQCSIEMTCKELAQSFMFFANEGKTLAGNTILSKSQVKRLNAIMQTCGFYDESGDFTYKVGLPGKSGIGGGIVAMYPNHFCVATWSPKLNTKGNSVIGIKALELLTTKTGMSIF